MAKWNQSFLDGRHKSSLKPIKLKLQLKTKTPKKKTQFFHFLSFTSSPVLNQIQIQIFAAPILNQFEPIFRTHWFENQLTNLNPFWIQLAWCSGGMVGTVSRLGTNLREREREIISRLDWKNQPREIEREGNK